MDNYSFFFSLGLFVGVVIIGIFWLATTPPEELTKCAKENNVYECEFIAVPKKVSE